MGRLILLIALLPLSAAAAGLEAARILPAGTVLSAADVRVGARGRHHEPLAGSAAVHHRGRLHRSRADVEHRHRTVGARGAAGTIRVVGGDQQRDGHRGQRVAGLHLLPDVLRHRSSLISILVDPSEHAADIDDCQCRQGPPHDAR